MLLVHALARDLGAICMVGVLDLHIGRVVKGVVTIPSASKRICTSLVSNFCVRRLPRVQSEYWLLVLIQYPILLSEYVQSPRLVFLPWPKL